MGNASMHSFLPLQSVFVSINLECAFESVMISQLFLKLPCHVHDHPDAFKVRHILLNQESILVYSSPSHKNYFSTLGIPRIVRIPLELRRLGSQDAFRSIGRELSFLSLHFVSTSIIVISVRRF